MTVAIDTNILLDVLLNDLDFYGRSKSLLVEYYQEGALIISPVVYAELLTQFIRALGAGAEENLNTFLKELGISLVNFSLDDLHLSAVAWESYFNKEKGEWVSCARCGEKNVFQCRQCQQVVRWRNHLITDFLIGAHAQNNARILLTRDRGFYRKYFTVKIVE